MATKTIPELDAAPSVADVGLLPYDSGTQTFKATLLQLKNFILAGVDLGPLRTFIGQLAAARWTTSTSPNRSWSAIAWSPSLGLYAAYAPSSTTGIYTSPDGVVWTARTTNNYSFVATQMVWAEGLGLFVAFAWNGSNDVVVTSPDGITWTSTVLGTTHAISGLAWSEELGLLVACSGSQTSSDVMTSPDAVNWTNRTTPTPDTGAVSAAWSPELGLFVCIGQSGGGNDQVITSPDGITWTRQTHPIGGTPELFIQVIWCPAPVSKFVACAYLGTNKIMISDDGITWTAHNTPTSHAPQSLAYSPELGVIIALTTGVAGKHIATSIDGEEWAQRPAGPSSPTLSWNVSAYSPELGQFVAAALGDSGTGSSIMISESIRGLV